MTPNVLASRPLLKERLTAIEQESERIFLKLADTLPKLVQEMQTSIQASRDEVKGIHSHVTTDSAGDNDRDLEDIIQDIGKIVQDGETTFQSLYQRDSELLNALKSTMERLRAVTEVIPAIRDDSEEMELVSINAMTMALKAGQAGRAFSYITDELKRLSARTIERSESITELGDRALETFAQFERLLTRARQEQDELFGQFQGRIDESLEQLRETVSCVLRQFESVQQRSEAVLDPVKRLMESLQLQDLIRQSIDHVLLSLEEMASAPPDDSEESLEEQRLFAAHVPALAAQLIGDVSDQLQNSADVFDTLVQETADRINAVDTERQKISCSDQPTGAKANGSSGEQTNMPVTAFDAFDRAVQLQDQILADLETNLELKGRVVGQSDQIKSAVRELQRQFHQFEQLVGRFHNIDIASRIEVSKQTVLQEMGSTVEQMTELTRRIETDVDRAISSTEAFITATSTVIDSAEDNYAHQVAFLDSFRNNIVSSRAAMEESRKRIVNLVDGFSLFTDGFRGLFQQTKEDAQQLRGLAEELDRVSEDFSKVSERENHGELDSIHSKRFQQLIQRFTILAHKQKAGSLGGIDVESGVESGEVTLF